jgi:hypothetical protein
MLTLDLRVTRTLVTTSRAGKPRVIAAEISSGGRAKRMFMPTFFAHGRTRNTQASTKT